MANQIEQLVSYFFQVVGKKNPGATYSNMVTTWIRDLLREGITQENIEYGMKINPRDFRTTARKIQKNSVGNLLRPGRFYYHPYLQVAPPPPLVSINDDGTFCKKDQCFFLKIKDRFTIENTLEYFYLRFPYIDRSLRRDIGAVEYLYNKAAIPTIDNHHDKDLNAIDLLMFTIDTSLALCHDEDRKLKKILELSNYMDDGLMVYLDKRENCILAGIDHVI